MSKSARRKPNQAAEIPAPRAMNAQSEHHAVFTQMAQFFIAKGYFSVAELKALIDVTTRDVCPDAYTVESMIHQLNFRFKTVEMSLRKCFYEFDNCYYYVLVNLIDSDSVRASIFDEKQLLHLKQIFETVILNHGIVSQNSITQNLLDVNISRNQAEKNLELFVKEGWLNRLENGQLCFGVRLIADLRATLDADERVTECQICNEVCFAQVRCKSACAGIFHKKCCQNLKECPCCRQSFQ